jgi:hypothetical protein
MLLYKVLLQACEGLLHNKQPSMHGCMKTSAQVRC